MSQSKKFTFFYKMEGNDFTLILDYTDIFQMEKVSRLFTMI